MDDVPTGLDALPIIASAGLESAARFGSAGLGLLVVLAGIAVLLLTKGARR